MLVVQDQIADQYKVFTAALGAIETGYVGEVESDRLVYGAISGMLQTRRTASSVVQPLASSAEQRGPTDPAAAESPNLNAYAERFVRSIKEECLNRVVPLGEGHLRLLVKEYVEHYHRERNHQGLDNQLLHRPPPPVSPDTDVESAWADFSVSTMEKPHKWSAH